MSELDSLYKEIQKSASEMPLESNRQVLEIDSKLAHSNKRHFQQNESSSSFNKKKESPKISEKLQRKSNRLQSMRSNINHHLNDNP